MTDSKFIMFFRNDINQELLVGTDTRIDIIHEVEVFNNLNNLEGIDFFKEWKILFESITKLWQQDLENGLPFFKMESTLLDKLAFYLDFVAQFFLYNGSEVDNDYLKCVDDFFQQHKIQRGEKESTELFVKAFRATNH
ncbi:MAG: hypothetical protein U0T74_09160 [Chitinophagales bacterium]